MVDILDLSRKIVEAYNDKRFDYIMGAIAQDIDFAHYNSGFSVNRSSDLVATMRAFAEEKIPSRKFLPPIREISHGDIVVREGLWEGTADEDIEGLADKGQTISSRICTIMRFDKVGIVVEWKDYG